MTDPTSYDTKRFPLCAPYTGEVGPAFTRTFKPAFYNALAACSDRFSNQNAHLRGMDPGGILPPSAAQRVANPSHINVMNPHPPAKALESDIAFKNREASCISNIRKHVLPVGLQLDIDRITEAAYIKDYGSGCPVFPAVVPPLAAGVAAAPGALAPGTLIYPADHPHAGRAMTPSDIFKYQQSGNSIARHIWAMVCEYGTKKQTALFNEMQNNNWANLKLSDVGITPRTIHDSAALLDKMSMERGLGFEKSDSEKLSKLLMMIDTPPALKQVATQELTFASPQCRNPMTQQPDWRLTIIWLNELWVNHYDQGDMKYIAPRVVGQPRSNRVDGLALACQPCDDPDDDDDEAMYIAQSFRHNAAAASNPLSKEPWCWNCLGWGHTKNENGVWVCPSPRQFRSLTDAKELIEARIARQGRSPSSRQGPPPARRAPPKGPRRHLKPRGSQRQPPGSTRDTKMSANSAQFDEGSDLEDEESDENEPELAAVAEADGVDYDAHVHFGSSEDVMLGLSLLDDVPSLDPLEDSPPDSPAVTVADSARPTSVLPSIKNWLAYLARTVIMGCNGSMLLMLLLLLFNRSAGVVVMPRASMDVLSASVAHSARGGSNVKETSALVDSGCSVCASGRASLFPKRRIVTVKPNVKVVTASGTEMPVAFIGTMVIKPKHAAKGGLLQIDNALHVPAMGKLTLLSPKQLFDGHGIETHLNDALHLALPTGCEIPIQTNRRCYYIELSEECASVNALVAAVPGVDEDQLIHQRCLHFSPQRLAASASCTRNLLHPNLRLTRACPACVRGGMKQPSASARKGGSTSKDPRRLATSFGDLVYSDTCSLPASQPFGYIGWVAFLDHATRWLSLYYIRGHTALEIRRCLDQFCVDNADYLPKVKGKPAPKTWLTDNHGEFISADTDAFCRELHMRHTSIIEWNPQQNPSERSHGTILRCIRITHAENNTPLSLWPWTANQCVLVHNSLLTTSQHVTSPLMSPYQMRSGQAPDLSRLRRMFCRVVCYNRSDHDRSAQSKIDVPTVDGIHLGLDERRRGVFVYVPSLRRFTTYPFRDCVFFEETFPSILEMQGPHLFNETSLRPSAPPVPFVASPGIRGGRGRGGGARGGSGRSTGRAAAASSVPVAPPAAPIVATRVTAAAPPPAESARFVSAADAHYVAYDDPDLQPIDSVNGSHHLCLNLTALSSLPTPPDKISDFKGRSDEEDWWKAARTEYDAKLRLGTFELVPRPKAPTNVVKTRLRCTYKVDPQTGALLDNKGHRVRWVACGYSQLFGKDYFQTYTATTKSAGIRVYCSMVAALDLDTEHIDVCKFFPSHALQEEVYCEQMPGFVSGGLRADGKSKLVCKLKMALEGLKQSGNTAQCSNVSYLTNECGFTQCTHEPTVFILTKMHNGSKVTLLLLVWVDDMWASWSKGMKAVIYDPFVKQYKKRYDIKEMGAIKLFIALSISRDRAARTLTISQEAYIADMVPKFVPADSLRSSCLPDMPSTLSSSGADPFHALVAQYEANDYTPTTEPYLSAIASALYATCMTRPDAAYAVAMLCRFTSRPSKEAWLALVKVLCYLYKTRKHGITYGGDARYDDRLSIVKPPVNRKLHASLRGLTIYSDASWKTGCTYAGFVILRDNAAIDWASKQLKVMLSSAEAEIGAGCAAGKRAIYVRNLIGELEGLPAIPIPHIVDNSALPYITENIGVSKKTEHFRRWQHFMRYLVNHNYIFVHLCKTGDMLANPLTKTCSKSEFSGFSKACLNTA